MPILVKDYTWIQSSTNILVRVPIDPVYREKVDLFTSDCYIKANFKPFLFELFLLHDVNINKSKCIINNDMIQLDLVKKDECEWSGLEKELSKEEKKNIRENVLKESQKKATKDAEEKAIRKSQLDRFTVQQAMDIDSRQHAIMESRKNEHCKKAMQDLDEWRNNKNEEGKLNLSVSYKSGVTITELPSSDEDEDPEYAAKLSDQSRILKESVKKKIIKSEYVEKKKDESSKRVLPQLRKIAQLEITHTPRSFPTPTRESTAAEEEAWIKNITLARRASGFVSEDLRPEEQDPQWCKEKGDEFFRNGNFLGAISAYTHGITLSDKLPSLFSNRAAAHFALGNFNKCANDCSTALDLMKPACEGNRLSRGKCIARRAASLARLGYLNKAIDELKAASKLLPEDDNIRQDIYAMERAWEQNPDSD